MKAFRKSALKALKYLEARAGDGDVQHESPSRTRLISEWYQTYSDVPGSYAFVAFSKDRPMQLHALLSSLGKACHNEARVDILYFASSADFASGYEKCIRLFSADPRLRFLRQSGDGSFRADLLQILESMAECRVIFLVDDIVFIRDFDLRDLDEYDLRRYVPSLRMGRGITYSYTTGRNLRTPLDLSKTGNLLRWRWQGNEVDWAYPLSVDGHIFLRSEMAALCEVVAFRSPNTLEASLQEYVDLYSMRQGVCYELPRLLNIPCNKVQQDFDNRHGALSAEDLLGKWVDGYAIDVERLRDFTTDSVHADVPVSFVKRKR